MVDPDSGELDELEQRRREETKELKRCRDQVGASTDPGIEVAGVCYSRSEIMRRLWWCIRSAADQVGLGDDFKAVNARHGEPDFDARLAGLLDQIVAVAPVAAERGSVLDERLYRLCFTLRQTAPAAA
jgi:hypothetical protein